MNAQVPSDALLPRLKRYAEQNAREPWIPVKAAELLTLVECVELLAEMHVADLAAIAKLPSTYPNGMDDVVLVKRSHELLAKVVAL